MSNVPTFTFPHHRIIRDQISEVKRLIERRRMTFCSQDKFNTDKRETLKSLPFLPLGGGSYFVFKAELGVLHCIVDDEAVNLSEYPKDSDFELFEVDNLSDGGVLDFYQFLYGRYYR